MSDKTKIHKRWSYGWKGIFINDLIEANNYKSYLELGVDIGTTWINVHCDSKTGVDINPESNFCDNGSGEVHKFVCDTDAFFAKKDPSTKFDIIYIDASHDKKNVRKDFINSVSSLNKSGLVILHDIFPKCEKDVLPTASGDVYDFWMSLCDFVEFENICTCINYEKRSGNDDAIGIYSHGDSNENFQQLKNKDYSYSEYQNKIYKYIFNLELDYLARLTQ